MFHFISSYDLVETEVYHQKFSFTRKWEDCGGLSDCEELVGVTHRISLGKSHDLS
jgi:hypothetical protein